MKNKWFLSAFIAILAILGFSLDKGAVPNQEITLRFTNTDTTLEQAQEAITLIEEQLNTLNIDQVKIEQFYNGTLKIKYYSTIKVSEIEKIVSEAIAQTENHIDQGSQDDSPPYSNDSKKYQLVINKLQDVNDCSGTRGNLVESKIAPTRSLPSPSYAFLSEQDFGAQYQENEIAYTSYRNPAIAIKNTSYKIPQVRAGPRA